MRLIALALAAQACCLPAVHAGAAEDRLNQALAQLLQRVERLEQDNRELRARLDRATAPPAAAAASASGAAPAPLESRVAALEQASQQADRALATDRLSETEPELVTRLKAVEFETLERRKQLKPLEALEGISATVALTGMAQSVNAAGAADGRAATRAHYRGDVTVTMPGGAIGDIEGKLFAHLRLGQGSSLALRPTFTSSTSSTAFQTGAGPDDSFAILAQAWLLMDIPLPREGDKRLSRQRLELTLGKIDPFVFFDQNAIADDETVRFNNNAFVHNPLLDSGGDTGADAYGFAPGLRLAYFDQAAPEAGWGASLGVFAAGAGANFSGGLGKAFVIGQLETSRRFFGGLAGNYRLYAWRNGQGEDADGQRRTHSGWGLSLDQRIDEDWTLFARAGRQVAGHPRFGRALTLGAETDGSRWGRGADGLGLAAGWLRSDAAYRAGGAANADERIVELYYRWLLSERVQITPDLQWIQRPGGRADAATIRTVGLRAKVGF